MNIVIISPDIPIVSVLCDDTVRRGTRRDERLETTTMATATGETNKRIARRVPEELATEHDLDLVDELFAPDAVENGPFGQETIRDNDARKEFMREVFTAFPDFEATVEDLIAEGDMVAMRVTLRGTHKGVFQGIEPTGKSFEISNLVFTRIEDGKIVERWVQPDRLGMLQQLGVAELPAA